MARLAYFKDDGSGLLSGIVLGRVQAGSLVSGLTGYFAKTQLSTAYIYRANTGTLTLLASVAVTYVQSLKLRLLLKTIGGTTEYQVDRATSHAGAYSTIINGIDSSPVLGAGLWGFGRSDTSGANRPMDIDDLSINDVT